MGTLHQKETKEGTSLYFSVLEWPADGKLEISNFKNKISSARLLADGKKLKTSVSKDGVLTIVLPSKAPDPIASVIKVIVSGRIVTKPVPATKK